MFKCAHHRRSSLILYESSHNEVSTVTRHAFSSKLMKAKLPRKQVIPAMAYHITPVPSCYQWSCLMPLIHIRDHIWMCDAWKLFWLILLPANLLSLGTTLTTVSSTQSSPRSTKPCHLIGSFRMVSRNHYLGVLQYHLWTGASVLLQMDVARCIMHPWCCQTV